VAPASAKTSAIPVPIPRAAPVMSAVFPARLYSGIIVAHQPCKTEVELWSDLITENMNSQDIGHDMSYFVKECRFFYEHRNMVRKLPGA
jgi:hypothetical protein